ncbi:MAG: AMP-binding protein [Alphaproteobacteria bacterium]
MSDGAPSLAALLAESCRRHAERPALSWPEAAASPLASLTYGALWTAVEDMAGRLLALGLAAGDRLAVQAGKSPTLTLLYLACIRSGIVFLPFNTAYRPAELAYMCGDARPSLLLCDAAGADDLAGVARAAGSRLLPLETTTAGGFADALSATTVQAAPLPMPAADAAAVMLYTSGTTGRPKGAVLTQANLATNTLALRDVWAWRDDDRLLHALPLYHTHGLFPALNLSLAGGGECLMLATFDAATVLRHLSQATVFMGVPTYYARLLREDALTAAACRHMRLFVSGSAPLPDALFHAFAGRTGQTIVERYGMTEAVMITSNTLDDRRPGCAGRPLPGVELRITDESGILPADHDGGIEIRGPNVFPGYWQAPDKTAEAFRDDGWFITGDRGRLDEAGRLWISGRSSDLIISGGLNVSPREVETVLDRLPGVAESAVIGVPHEEWGEAVVALVCAAAGGPPPDESALLAGLGDLAAFKRPKRVVVVDSLPRNAMGKVEKARLRKEWQNLFTARV